MGRAVDSAGESAHHDEAVRGELEAEPLGHPEPGLARRTGADHRDARGLAGFERAARDHVRRRVGDLFQIRRVVGVDPSHQAGAEPRQFAEFLFERRKTVETRKCASDIASDSSCRDLLFGGFKNPLGGAEAFEQQPARSRPRAMHASSASQ